ncbi:MAG: hypothetical protein ISS63_00095 [Desulfobacteraceae bacterium]|nr:hypothetical protein [Desulfobacteraceae bacterium]
MGEIRSTLDIIMEKAERVTVTDEERAAFIRSEVEGKVRGLLQKHLDGIINQERLKKEVEAMGGEHYVVATAALKKECLGRIEPGEGNRPLLEILAHVVGLDTKPVRELLSRYQQEQEEKRGNRESALKERLKDQGISGTAVLPNLGADPEWTRYLSEVKVRFHQRIAAQYGML